MENIQIENQRSEFHASCSSQTSVGKDSRAVTPRGLEVETRFVVCEADVPITSHDVNLNPNPAFPARIQNRDRGKVSTEDDLNEKIARFEPGYLGESISAGDGAPIVGPDWVVESGNGRLILLRRLYRDHPLKARRYRDWLIDNFETFGISLERIGLLTKPVLVRLRTSELSAEERIAFAVDANTDPKLKLSAVEVARSDAARLTEGLLNQLYVDDDGEILSAANRPFIAAFLDDVVGPARGDLLTSDGQLSQAGVLRVKAAIFAKAYGDTDAGIQALEKLSESTDVNIKRLINAMLRYASRFAWLKEAIAAGVRHPLDLAPDLAEVARQLSLLREQGRTVEEHLKQMGLFGETMSRIQKKLLFVFNQYRNSAKAMGGILGKYLDAIDALGDPKQISFVAQTIPSKEELLERAVRLYENGEGEQGGLFGETPIPTIGGDKQALFVEQAEVAPTPTPTPEPEPMKAALTDTEGSLERFKASYKQPEEATRRALEGFRSPEEALEHAQDFIKDGRADSVMFTAEGNPLRMDALESIARSNIVVEPTPQPEAKPQRKGGRPKSPLPLKTRRQISKNRRSMTRLVTAFAHKTTTQGEHLMAEETTITFSKKKETPGTVVYSEDDRPGQPPLVGTLYLKKFFAAGRETVTVTIS